MNRGRASEPNDLQRAAHEQLRAAVISEQRASWVAAVVPIGLWIWVLRDPILPAFTVLIFVGAILRSRALPAIDRGEIERAVLVFMIGKWAISIALAFVLPIALPIVVVNLIMPIALGSTNLSSHRFVPLTVASVAVAFTAAVLGYTTNFLRLEDEVTTWVWQWLCAIILAVHFIPLCIILWRSNQQQAMTYEEALSANALLVESESDLRSSRRRLVSIADAERSRIERDLHDGAQQRLVAVLVQLRLANRQRVQAGDDAGRVASEALADELEAAITEIRDLAHGIYPPLLTARGLGRALNAVARRSVADVVVEATDLPRSGAAIEAAVYFCCVEAMHNSTKHAGPDVSVQISLSHDGSSLHGEIRDDGPGFDSGRTAEGKGITNMSDRIGAAGGVIEFDGAPDTGSIITFSIPCAGEQPNLVEVEGVQRFDDQERVH